MSHRSIEIIDDYQMKVAAVRADMTVTTVCNLAASGELPGFKIGKSWRFTEAEALKQITAAK